MEPLSYWDDIDVRLDKLVNDGYVKLPSLERFGLDMIADEISAEMNGSTFSELCSIHQSFLQDLALDENLTSKLFQIATDLFGYKGKISNQYHIARSALPGDQKYRAHFDSHMFTLVIPISIPQVQEKGGTIGELVFFPNTRAFPKNPFFDFIGKLWFKQYSSKSGMERLSKKRNMIVNSFNDYEPLLFLGNTVFHSNQPISSNVKSHRLTLLAHYFDPFPKYGIGSLLRKIRFR